MPGTHDAVRLVELTAACLCREAAAVSGAGLPLRLALLLAAWGPDSGAWPLDRIVTLAAGLPNGIGVDPSGLEAGSVFPPRAGRIVLNLLLLAAEALPSGGVVLLAGSVADMFMRIDGAGAAWPPGTAACLANPDEARTALATGPSLQLPLTALLARASGVRLSVLIPPVGQNQPAMLRLGG